MNERTPGQGKGATQPLPWWVWPTVIVLGLFVRLVVLEAKPPHFDEGVNGWFVQQLLNTGVYVYDPANFHGPLLPYVLFVTQRLLGDTLWSLRLPCALAGALTVWLARGFSPFVGERGAVIAALGLAVSPGMVFYSRYAIHEPFLMLFTMLVVLSLLHWLVRGSAWALHGLAFGAAGMLITKETAWIHLGVLILVTALCYRPLIALGGMAAVQARTNQMKRHGVRAIGMAVLLWAMFYSSFGLNPAGLEHFFWGLDAWVSHGIDGSHFARPWTYYFSLINHYEWLVWLGLLGWLALWSTRVHRSIALRWIGLYGVLTMAVYSAVPYKTPWLIINLLWPWLLLLGWVLTVNTHQYAAKERFMVSVVLVLTGGLWSFHLNARHATDPNEPYVYMQTFNDIQHVMKRLDAVVKEHPLSRYERMHVVMASQHTWPLPWLFRNYPNARFWSADDLPASLDGLLVVNEPQYDAVVRSRLRQPYTTHTIALRPGVEHLMVRYRSAMGSPFSQETP